MQRERSRFDAVTNGGSSGGSLVSGPTFLVRVRAVPEAGAPVAVSRGGQPDRLDDFWSP